MFLECSNLRREFAHFSLDVSFSVEENHMASLVGPSGSGKSTILSMIAGLVKPEKSCGTKIILDGKDITNLEPGKRNCGMVFQNPSLFLNMSVEDNVAYGLISRGMKKKEARKQAELFLEKFNMAGFAKRNPETLSGGEAQRVALARTLIVQPKLVLFDEPLSALDEDLRKKLAQEIRNMQRMIPFTAIMVTHDIKEALSISDDIIQIEKGKIVWCGKSCEFNKA
ncbi:MAG: ABC transporter ATP-binding protein [Treponema sp.]|nr:ABC transporter ATP-binding protein [Treponema sp.]